MVNKVTLIGNLGGDPEIKHLENGTAVGRLSLATNESWKDSNGEWQKQTEWHNIVVWRGTAEYVEKHLKKGMLVYIEGKISYRKYTTQEGVEKYITDIVANTVRILEKREGGDDYRIPTEDTSQKNTPPGDHAMSVPTTTHQQAPADNDDLPF